MTGKRIWKFVFALVVITVLAFGGMALYRLGFTHGALTNITLPEGSEFPMMPYAYRPFGGHYGPRVGLLGLFPLLCFGGFFFLALMFGGGCLARRWAWMRYSTKNPEYWKKYGPPHGRPGCPPWADDQPEAVSETPPKDSDQTAD